MLRVDDTTPSAVIPCLLNLIATYFTDSVVVYSSKTDSIANSVLMKIYIPYTLWDGPFDNAIKMNALILFSEDAIFNFENVSGWYEHVIVLNAKPQMLHPLWTRSRAMDTLFLTETDEGLDAFTWYPYTDCKNKTPTALKYLDSCNTEKNWNKNMFPNKVPTNFDGCNVVHLESENEQEKKTSGLEGKESELMTILAQSLGLKVVSYEYPAGENMFYDEDSYDSAINLVLRGQVDFIFGGMLLDQSFVETLYTSPVFDENAAIWILPKPKRRDRTYAVFESFSLRHWFAILLLLAVSTLLCYGFQWVETSSSATWVDVFALFIASPSKIQCDSSVFRFFAMIFQLYSLHIVWFYQATLLGNLFKVPEEKPLTVREAVSAGYPAYVYSWSPYSNATGDQGDKDMWEQIYANPNFHPIEWPMPYEKVVKERAAIMLCFYLPDALYIEKMFKRGLFGLVTVEEYVNTPITMYGYRGSPLSARYQRQILAIVEGGIYAHLTDFPRIVRTRNRAPEALELEVLRGAFLLLGVGSALASLVFVSEVLTGRRCQNRNKTRTINVRNSSRKDL